MSNNWFVNCARGLEPLLLTELKALGVTKARETVAGVEFMSELATAYRVCLWSRLANRVFLNLRTFPVTCADDIYIAAKSVAWENHFELGATIAVDFVGAGSGIDNTQFGALRIKDGVVDRFRDHTGRRPSIDARQPDIGIHARLVRHNLTLSLDFSGGSLHRRGYRKIPALAPLKENLAAALLFRAGWPSSDYSALVDPMCGSGTLLIEGAMMVADVAPGIARSSYGFLNWSGHHPVLWQEIYDDAVQRKREGLARQLPVIVGFDIDQAAIEAARVNISAAGLDQVISVERRSLKSICSTSSEAGARGLVIVNPPYGERLGVYEELVELYRDLGSLLKRQFGGWRAAIFSANEALCFELGLRSDRQYKLFNGKIPAKLLLFDIFSDPDKSGNERDGKQEDAENHHYDGRELTGQGTMLANRLRKNQRKLQPWLRSQGIECYRIYDGDLPEYAVAIDCYGDAVCIQEYAPPPGVDAARAEERIHQGRIAVETALKIPPQKLFIKQRQRQRGDRQYQRTGEKNTAGTLIVREYDQLFEVNLADYLDTGLFLDHRATRRLLRANCMGKRFLNLFCYTASASVCAVAGGAIESVSIDLSKTYLAWAKRNYTRNGIDLKRHRLLRDDCMAWLAKGGDSQFFDIIFLDPPSFSNSARMNSVLDIQKDHETLIRQAVQLLSTGGQLIFSTNLRSFKMAEGIGRDFFIKDLGNKTIDRDFARRPNVHRCWEIRINKPGE